MSWSVSAMGKGDAVGRSLATQFDGIYKMAEPEQTMKDKVAEILECATAGAPDQGFVVRAEGSQWTDGSKVRAMHLKVEIDVMQFCE